MLNESTNQPTTITSLTPLMWNAALVILGVCLGIGLAALAGIIHPGSYAVILPWLALLISIESLYSRAVGRRVTRTFQQRILYAVSEWIVIGILLKFVILAGNGFATLASEAQSWLKDFYTFIFEPAFLFSLIVLLVVWFVVRALADDLTLLALDERKLLRRMQVTEDRGGLGAIRETFASHVIAGGIGLAVVLALATMARTLAPAPDVAAVPALSLLIYFTISLLLLGHTRVRAATGTWVIEEVEVEPELGLRWAGFGLAVVLGVAVIALLLAAGNPLTLFESLSIAVRSLLLGIVYLISTLWMLLVFAFQLVAYAIFYILSLFSNTEAPAQPQMQPLPPPQLEPASSASLEIPWGSTALVIIGVVIVISAIYYLISRRLPAGELRNAGGLFGLLRQRLSAFWHWLKGVLSRPADLLQSLRSDTSKAAAKKEAAISMQGQRAGLRNMTARALVRYYYGLLLQRGAQSGLPRNPAQTPSEYAQVLDQQAPDAAQDVDHLTATYIEARYSTHDVSDQQAAAVREWFIHIRNALRPRRKSSKP